MAPKQKPNGFLLFMLDFKKREERRGRTFPNGIRDVQCDPECSNQWKNMDPQKRAEYNGRAKNQKLCGKKTGAGECMDAVERARRRQLEFQQNMNEEIQSMVALAMELGNLPSIKFDFIHSNWFYARALENNEFDYVPAEFAVSVFSLRDGVTDIYHEILKTEIRTGYTREAMETSQETHQIPWNLKSGENSFTVMCEKLLEFLKPRMNGGKYPPLYTSRKIRPVVKSLLNRMTLSLNLPEDTFIVYELEVLFTHLRNASQQKFDTFESFKDVMAEYELIKDVFSYTPGLDCDYHKNLDGTSQFCSMSIVKRWAFTICDYCCENLDIEMQPGVHLPLRVKTNLDSISDTIHDLSDKMSMVDIQEVIGIKSMTGVSKEHRLKTSSRTAEEEKRRRNDKTPVTVINYAKRNEVPENDVTPSSSGAGEYQRRLRTPYTLSEALTGGRQEELNYNEREFPSLDASLGRGLRLKKRANGTGPGTGRGRGIALT